MPEVDFSRPNPRLDAIKRKSKKYAKEVNKVYPTIYEIKRIDITDDEPDFEKRIRLIKTNIAGRRFCCLSYKYFLENNIRLNSNTFALLMYICDCIEFNSNAVKITREKAANALQINVTTVDDAINNLCDYDVICKTDIRSLFIINHNVVFKGNLVDFTLIYNDVFHNIIPERVNDVINDYDYVENKEIAKKGRILIKKYISNGKYKSTSK